MIESFADGGTADIFDGVNSKAARKTLPAALWPKGRRKLDDLNHVRDVRDLRLPPSNRLHALKGDRKGQYAIAINKQYRICFTWRETNAHDVEITDYHD